MRLLSLAVAAFLVAVCSADLNLLPEEIDGLKAQCWGPGNSVPERKNPGPGSLTEGDCQSCVDDAYASSISQAQAKMYGCYAMCQNSTAMNFPDLNTVEEDQLTDDIGDTAAQQCYGCLSSYDIVDPYACQTCIFDINYQDADPTQPNYGTPLPNDVDLLNLRKECIECAANDPYQGTKKEYFYACAQCTLLTNAQAKQYCRQCVQQIINDPEGELPPSFTNTDQGQIPYPAYEFGKCVAASQSLQALLDGKNDPSGIQSLCFDAEEKYSEILPAAFHPSVDDCIQCVITSTIVTPFPAVTSVKAYGCSQYCLDPKVAHNQAEVDQCEACITTEKILDPWSCWNCMDVIGTEVVDEEDRLEQRGFCFECLRNDPYEKNLNFSNYAWACGQCAGIVDTDIRSACYSCIRNLTSAVHNPDDICQCIDSTVNQGMAVPFGMDAMQRTCFANWTVDVLLNGGAVDLQLIYMYLNETSLEDTAYLDELRTKFGIEYDGIPLHALGGFMPTNGAECLECMAEMELYQEKYGGPDRRYACRQYCEDPTLVLDLGQAEKCITTLQCVITHEDGKESPLDPWAVQNCMVVSTTLGVWQAEDLSYPLTEGDVNYLSASTVDEEQRDKCFECICKDPGEYDSFAWACGACSQFADPAAQQACFDCLYAGGQDPCQCVDDTKNPPPSCPEDQVYCEATGTCGYLLVLTAFGDPANCPAELSGIELQPCWAEAAFNFGAPQQCGAQVTDPTACTATVSMIFSSLTDLEDALAAFDLGSNSGTSTLQDWTDNAWPNADFMACANLPCGISMVMYPQATPSEQALFFCQENPIDSMCQAFGDQPCTPPNQGCGFTIPPSVCTGDLELADPSDLCSACVCPSPLVPVSGTDQCECVVIECLNGLVHIDENDECSDCKCPGDMTFDGPGDLTSADQCDCPPGATETCPGSSLCGFKLVLEAFSDQGDAFSAPTLDSLDDCWRLAAQNMPGYLETCDGVTYIDGVAHVSMIFASQEDLDAALEAFGDRFDYTDGVSETMERWRSWPNTYFINCAQLPCTTTLKMFQDPEPEYTESTTVPIHTYFSCGELFSVGSTEAPSYGDLAQGDASLIRPDLCYQSVEPGFPTLNGAKGKPCPCSDCPPVEIWKWIGKPIPGSAPSNIEGFYWGGGPENELTTGPDCLQHFPGCQKCHGNCCVLKAQNLIDAALAVGASVDARRAALPECPTSSCPGNALWPNSAKANHVGSCGSPAYVFDLGTCGVAPAPTPKPSPKKGGGGGGGRRRLNEELVTITGRELMASPAAGTVYTSIRGPGWNTDTKTNTYYAFCDYEAYPYSDGDLCVTEQAGNQVNHCIGRVACRDGETGARVDCIEAFGPTSNVGLAQGVDCFADGNSDNWKMCGYKALPPDGDFCEPDPTEPSCEAPVESCDPKPWIKDAEGYVGSCDSDNCHGNCDRTAGTCPYNNCLSYTPGGLAHVGSNDLGTTTINCQAGDNFKYNKACPFSNDGKNQIDYYATCVPYTSGCTSGPSGYCLGQVKCHASSTGAVVDCSSVSGAEVGIEDWEGIDCIIQADSDSTTAGFTHFKVCACATPSFAKVGNGQDAYYTVSGPI